MRHGVYSVQSNEKQATRLTSSARRQMKQMIDALLISPSVRPRTLTSHSSPSSLYNPLRHRKKKKKRFISRHNSVAELRETGTRITAPCFKSKRIGCRLLEPSLCFVHFHSKRTKFGRLSYILMLSTVIGEIGNVEAPWRDYTAGYCTTRKGPACKFRQAAAAL